MEQVPLIKRIFNAIINFLKMLFLYIVKFFLILLGMEEKKEQVSKEIIVVTEELKSSKKEIKEPEFSVPVDPSSLINNPNGNDEKVKKDEHVIYKHISNQADGNVRIYTISFEFIDKLINSYIEEKEEIKLEKIDKDLKNDIKEWKEEIIVPQIKLEFKKKYITNNDILVVSLEKILDKELEIQHDKVLEKKENNEVLPKREFKSKDNLIVDFKRELKYTPTIIIEEKKEPIVQEEPIVVQDDKEDVIEVPKQEEVKEEKNELQLKDEINNILLDTALVMSNVEKVLVEKKVEEKKKKDVTDEVKQEVTEVQDIVVPVNQDETEVKEDPIPTPPTSPLEVDEVKQEVTVTVDKEDKIKDINEILEEEIVEIQVKEEKKDNEVIKKEEIVIKEIELPDLEINNERILDKVRDERHKEDFEDRDYDSLENKIDQALERIEMFIVMNESKLTKEQIEKLNLEKEKLQRTKEKINKQREFDIEVEKQHLEDKIANRELIGLQEELQRRELENQILMNNLMINNLEDLEHMTSARAREIEKKLLKLKLKEACRALSIPSLFALPFVRNKYFFFFTIGLFVNRNLGFIGNVFRRQNINSQEADLDNLVQGKDALNGALDMMRENLDYLDVLEQQALSRYPELAKDSEYLLYLRSLRHKLTANYNRLNRRQFTIDRLIYKTRKNVKVLKRKKKKYYNNAA